MYEKKVAHTRLPSVGFRSWSRFLAVSLQAMWVTNPAVGCHCVLPFSSVNKKIIYYFPPGLQLPPQPLRGTNFAAWWTEARWVWTVCLRLNLLVPVSNLPGRRRLRSSFTQQLLVPPYRLSTVGRRSFPVAASTFWNTLPNDIQSAPSLSSFRPQLKTFLFRHSSLTLSSNFLYCAFVDFATV